MGPLSTSSQLATLGSQGFGLSQGGAPANVLGYQQLKPPPPPVNTGGYSTGSSGGSGVSAQTAANNSYWNNLISETNSAINSLGTQAAVGHGNIAQDYQNALNALTGQRNFASTQHDTQVNDNQQQNDYSKANIDNNVHNTTTGLQRLLGMNGSGNSSAALITAPYAAAQQGNQQRQDVDFSYGMNDQNIDQAWKKTLNDFDNGNNQLGAQRHDQDSQLDQQIAQNKQSLLQNLQRYQAAMGQAPDANATNEINGLNNQIAQLGAHAAFTYNPVAYQAANLASYTPRAESGPQQVANPNTQSDNTGAYYNLLTDPNKKQTAGATA